jgi:tetratricopeptide (TPR) repeat protein
MREVLIGLLVLAATAVSGGALAEQSNNPLADKSNRSATMDAGELVKLGHLHVEAMDLDRARELYDRALDEESGFGEARYGLAKIQMAKGRLEKSKRACRVLERRNRDSSVGQVCSGWVWLTFDRSARAIDEFDEVIEKGDIARGKTGMGEAYRRRVSNQEAIAAYRAAIAAGAGHVARIGLGLALEASGDHQGAVAALRDAVETEPASCRAHYELGRVLGEGSEAIEQLGIALAIRPDWIEARHALGEAYLASGDFAAAEEAFRAALEGDQERGTAYLGLGKALYGQNQPEEAREPLEKAIEEVPNLVDAYLLLADIEYASGDSDAALDALDKAKSVAPGVVKVYLHTGETYFRLGRYTSARSHLKQAISMKPDLSLAHVILGDIACERRLYELGQQHYEDALQGDLQGVTRADIEKRRSVCKPSH